MGAPIRTQDKDGARMWCTLVRTAKAHLHAEDGEKMHEASAEEGEVLLDPETKLQHRRRLSFPHLGGRHYSCSGATRQAEEGDP